MDTQENKTVAVVNGVTTSPDTETPRTAMRVHKPKRVVIQAANGGTAIALATILAWGAAQGGVDMPGEVVAAVATLIGWLFRHFEGGMG